MITDPLAELQSVFKSAMAADDAHDDPGVEVEISPDIAWRPHLFEQARRRAWYLHTSLPDTDSWFLRIERARKQGLVFSVGVAAPMEAFLDHGFIRACDELGAYVAVFEPHEASYRVVSFHQSVPDFVCELRLQLDSALARDLLDRALERAVRETDANRKGVLLEVCVALLLSQVRGFEIHARDISNRSQQMDVMVHNRNSGGTFAASPVVLAEAKNWKDPVTPTEYAEFVRKLNSRHGRAKLGFLVTTSRFTEGVALERRRESNGETLVVLIDGLALPAVWRSTGSITDVIEKLTLEALVGD